MGQLLASFTIDNNYQRLPTTLKMADVENTAAPTAEEVTEEVAPEEVVDGGSAGSPKKAPAPEKSAEGEVAPSEEAPAEEAPAE